jgi:hypothetical protein
MNEEGEMKPKRLINVLTMVVVLVFVSNAAAFDPEGKAYPWGTHVDEVVQTLDHVGSDRISDTYVSLEESTYTVVKLYTFDKSEKLVQVGYKVLDKATYHLFVGVVKGSYGKPVSTKGSSRLWYGGGTFVAASDSKQIILLVSRSFAVSYGGIIKQNFLR